MSRTLFAFLILLIAAIPFLTDNSFCTSALASAYYTGRGVGRNQEIAMRWYRKAALGGSADAAFILGSAYFDGDGIRQSPAAAAFWWRYSAEKGNRAAQAAIGDAYCMGIGVSANAGTARRWWKLAALQGNEHAEKMLLGNGCTGHRPFRLQARSSI